MHDSQKVKGQGHVVIKCAVGMGIHVDRTVYAVVSYEIYCMQRAAILCNNCRLFIVMEIIHEAKMLQP